MSDLVTVSKVVWDDLVAAKEELGKVKQELAQKEKELLDIMPLLSIRKELESFECLIVPELKDPQTVFTHPLLAGLKSTGQLFDYHEGKWIVILSKTTDPRVVSLKSLLSTEGIAEDIFCRSMASFFIYSSAFIHVRVPSIKKYSEKKMRHALTTNFSIHDDVTLRCITKVLMKLS
ncbi:uncharacterized protein LOC135845093 [Planococcus citri]|uniref:uncharacterized protein LOC135845093 n=1 Tax=Planococcus citri TaxID=170843 RepID=UPI0031F80902